MVVWIIGLSGAGKSTLATELVDQLRMQNKPVVSLDGDVIREVFGNDLGYSMADRLLNAQRICKLGQFLESQGMIVVSPILSLFPETREWNRKNLKSYIEVFIDAPMHDLIERDSKGIYGKYSRGDISNVAGMDIEFIRPTNPDLVINNVHSKQDLLRYVPILIEKISKA